MWRSSLQQDVNRPRTNVLMLGDVMYEKLLLNAPNFASSYSRRPIRAAPLWEPDGCVTPACPLSKRLEMLFGPLSRDSHAPPAKQSCFDPSLYSTGPAWLVCGV